LQGQKFRLREGLRVGRTTGEILLDDPKVSSLHAQVESDGRGGYVLVDRGSANGLRINSQRVKRVAMLLGVRFQVGKTTLKVIESFSQEEDLPPLQEARRTWQEVLIQEVPNLATRNLDQEMRVEAFRPALQLDFVRGVQFEQSILLGYGPRRFGSDVLDIELMEALCPPVAFELRPQQGETIFYTQYPKLVLLNGAPVAESSLKEGDRIQIGQTLIQVSFAT